MGSSGELRRCDVLRTAVDTCSPKGATLHAMYHATVHARVIESGQLARSARQRRPSRIYARDGHRVTAHATPATGARGVAREGCFIAYDGL